MTSNRTTSVASNVFQDLLGMLGGSQGAVRVDRGFLIGISLADPPIHSR